MVFGTGELRMRRWSKPMLWCALLLAAVVQAAPKKKAAPPPAPVSTPEAAAPTPAAPLPAPARTAAEALAQLDSLYKTLEYAAVIPLAEQVLARSDLSSDQRLEAYRLQGSAKAIVEDPVDAERPFRLLLRARPDYDMPAETPPKILAVFRKVQSEEKALASQLRGVERSRLIAALRLSGEPAKEAQGGRPIRFNYRVRDTAGVVETVKVQFRRAGQKAFSSLALERSEDGEWRGVIPGEFTADDKGFTLEYLTETADREGVLLAAGSQAQPLTIEVAAGQVPVQAFKPVSKPVFFATVGLTAAVGAAAGVLGFLYNREQSAFDRAVATAGANGADLVSQIARGEGYAMATNVLMVSTAVLLAASLILLPLTRFFED